MKKRLTDSRHKVCGYYINDFIRGFMGEHAEGKRMLEIMGLPSDAVPFSVATFFHHKRIYWRDKDGNRATVWVKFKPNQLECFGTYRNRKRSLRLFVEWDSVDDYEMVARLESEAIGELCMRCIYENLTD